MEGEILTEKKARGITTCDKERFFRERGISMNRWKRKAALAVLGALGMALASCASPRQTHEHDFDRQVATGEYLAAPAGCLLPASYYYSCECGEKGTETFVHGDPLGHDFSASVATEEHLYSPADHRNPATYYYSCRRCGENDPSRAFEYGDRVPHVFDRQVPTGEYLAIPADCETPASYYYSCECGEKGTETFVHGDPLGHDFSASVATEEHLYSPADHRNPATYYYSCRRCGENDPSRTFEYGDRVPHVFDRQVPTGEYLATPSRARLSLSSGFSTNRRSLARSSE